MQTINEASKQAIDTEYNKKRVLEQITNIRNVITFKEALIKLTADEIEVSKKDIEFLQDKYHIEAENSQQTKLFVEQDIQPAANGQH